MNDTNSTPKLDTPHERLRAARIRAGFRSAAKAAEHMGVVATTYRSHENGFRGFDLEDAIVYGPAFSVTPEYLLRGAEAVQAQRRGVPTRDTLIAVMTEGLRIAKLSELPPEYVADMMIEALEAYEDDPVAQDAKAFARIHLGALARRSGAR